MAEVLTQPMRAVLFPSSASLMLQRFFRFLLRLFQRPPDTPSDPMPDTPPDDTEGDVPPAVDSKPILRRGDGIERTSAVLHGAVSDLQRLLNRHAFGLAVDGQFGVATEVAVRRFQTAHQLVVDGVVGQETWHALETVPASTLGVLLPTTLAIHDAGMLEELHHALRYKPLMEMAARQYDFPSSVLAGIGSQESRWGLALRPPHPGGTGDFARRDPRPPFRIGSTPSDGGFGRGLFQIDYDWHEFARTGNWQDPKENIFYGCQVLTDSRDQLARQAHLTGDALLRAALAGYNAGWPTVLKAVRSGKDPDSVTTHHSYARTVLNKAGWYQRKGWV